MKNILIIGPTSTIAKSYIDHNKSKSNKLTEFSLSKQVDLFEGICEKIYNDKFDSVMYFGNKKNESSNSMNEVNRFINVELPIKIAKICQRYGSQFLVFSSTRIFSEKESFLSKKTNYSPETNYGRQKVELEKGVLKYDSKVLRLTKVINEHDELWQSWYKSIFTGAKAIAYRHKFISPVFLEEVVVAIDRVLETNTENIFQFSRDIEISFESLFKKFLKQIMQKNKSLIDKGGVEFLNSNTTHSSLECDTDLKQCIGEFDFQFKEFVRKFI
jgi:dTDP-4-dehydrorhamnose reductase